MSEETKSVVVKGGDVEKIRNKLAKQGWKHVRSGFAPAFAVEMFFERDAKAKAPSKKKAAPKKKSKPKKK